MGANMYWTARKITSNIEKGLHTHGSIENNEA